MNTRPLRVLFVTPECAPWVKTGGLGDVSAALPAALHALGHDVRVLLPAYRAVLAAAKPRRVVATIPARAQFPESRLLAARLPSGVPAWLLHSPSLYDREGGPYQDPAGADWADNALRFGLLSYAAVAIARRGGRAWRPQVIHGNDWQAGLAPAYLHYFPGPRPATLQCVHNLAFQGLFPLATREAVGLPPQSAEPEGIEFFGRISFLKAGLRFADAIVTVSPGYAAEIQREPLGFGLQGLLGARSAQLHGIVNGIDTREWNPARDALIARRYDAGSLAAKLENKRALQAQLGLAPREDAMLFGVVARLTEQKGADLIAAVAPRLAAAGAQLAVLGTGQPEYEGAIAAAAQAHPGAVAARIGFDEALAHLVMAGADAFLMPSRFEPCGLNQMYGQRYGTPPIAHATGGLRDTITASGAGDAAASGFLFDQATAQGLWGAIGQALAAWREPVRWQALQRAGMARDFGWAVSARAYARLYAQLSSTVTAST